MINSLISIGSTLIDRLIPDKNQRAQAKEELARMEANGELELLQGQLRINQQEAAHKSIFVAGWRPAVGWICAIAMGYSFVLYPLMKFTALLLMDNPPDFPTLSLEEMMPVLLGMLGLGGMRSWEKSKGVSREK